MNISDLLAPDAVIPALKVQNKKLLLQELAARAALQIRLPEKRILETLIERERLGTTGVGQGIAIPHGRMEGVTLRAYDIARGAVMAYYPEANVLTGRAVDPRSKTPAFKSTPVRIVPA